MSRNSFFAGSAEGRAHAIDILDDTIQNFMTQTFPGPWKAQGQVQATGIRLGFNNAMRGPITIFGLGSYADHSDVLRKSFQDFKETVITHSFGHSFRDIPQGQAKLDYAMLRYRAIRLALDCTIERSKLSLNQAHDEAKQIVSGINSLLENNPKFERLYLNPYTDGFCKHFDPEELAKKISQEMRYEPK